MTYLFNRLIADVSFVKLITYSLERYVLRNDWPERLYELTMDWNGGLDQAYYHHHALFVVHHTDIADYSIKTLILKLWYYSIEKYIVQNFPWWK